MSKDNTTNNSGDKSQEFNSAGKDQSASSSAQGQRDYENLINKSLEEQITDTAISRADITNPNLHYGIEEEVEKIGDVAPQTTKKEGKFLEQSEKSEIEQTTTRLADEQNSQRIEELKSEELAGNDVPQSPGNLEKVESSDKAGPTDTLPEEETTPDGRTSGGDKNPETGTETNTGGSTTPQPEGESFNPDLITTGNSVDENSAEGTVIATLNLEDAAGSAFVYYISDENGSPLSNTNFTIVGNELVVSGTADLDFESLQSHNIFITGIDGEGNSVTEPFAIEVNDVNEFDVSAITDTDGSANAVDENASVGTSVGITAFASDADGSNNGVTYSLSDDAGGLFAIDPNTGEVTVAGAIDYETATSQTIEVTATSDDGSTSTQSYTINVNDQDEFDVSAISDTDNITNAINENSAIGTSVGITAFASDADGSNNGVTYSLSDDAGGLFAIDPNTGEVTVAGAIDFETATNHSIEVTATSEDGSTSTQVFAINVNDQDEFDVSAITDTDASTNVVDENASIGTSVGITAFASDADGSNNGVTYSLSDDAGGLFAIDPNTGEVTVAGSIDYETATNHSIEVTATSEDGSTSTQTFAINVNDQDEFDVSAITDTDASANTVAENVSVGTSVGITAFASDADGSNNGVTYSLSNDAGGLFAIDPNTGEVTVAGSIDYETATNHSIEVTATSDDGSTSTQTFAINVNDQDEFDVSAITDTDGSANAVDENASVGTSVGITAFASDADGTNNGVTYSLSDDAGGLFAIDPNTGEVTVAGAIDYETATNHSIEVTATSEDGSTSTQTFAINVNDQDEFDVSAITDTDTDTNAVDENSAVGTSVGITAFASDADGTNNGVTYSLSDDAGGLFAIDPNTGEVTVAGSIDFETATNHSIEVTATSDDGSTSTQVFAINVNDQDEFDVSAITDTDTDTNAVDENSAVGTSVGITAFASDADGSNNGITYSLSDDAGGLFAIDANTGEVTVAGSIDYETATNHSIEVTATSDDGSTSTQVFAINVNDQDEFDVSAITDTDASANTVDENASVGTSVGITAFASDADGSNNGVTY
ncbi:MAG: cadherin repeat domain-containing protein, partial [Hyphomicrobiales bacterium]